MTFITLLGVAYPVHRHPIFHKYSFVKALAVPRRPRHRLLIFSSGTRNPMRHWQYITCNIHRHLLWFILSLLNYTFGWGNRCDVCCWRILFMVYLPILSAWCPWRKWVKSLDKLLSLSLELLPYYLVANEIGCEWTTVEIKLQPILLTWSNFKPRSHLAVLLSRPLPTYSFPTTADLTWVGWGRHCSRPSDDNSRLFNVLLPT